MSREIQALRLRYFELLMKRLNGGNNADPGICDRIERLLRVVEPACRRAKGIYGTVSLPGVNMATHDWSRDHRVREIVRLCVAREGPLSVPAGVEPANIAERRKNPRKVISRTL